MPQGTNQAVNNQSQKPSPTEFEDFPTREDITAQRQAAAELKAQGVPGTQGVPVEQPATQQVQEPQLPEKFQGKSAAEIAQSYADLEARMGQQSQEIGTLRGLTDQLLDLKRTDDLAANGVQQELTEISSDDVLLDPRNAISTVASEQISPVNARIDNLESELRMREFRDSHPTFLQDQNDPKFQEFVKSSPYRTNLAQKLADSAARGRPDVDAAEELWSAWDDVRGTESAGESSSAANTSQGSTQLKDAALASRGGGDSAATQPKIYSRAKLMDIMINDRERYDSPEFQALLTKAYTEGRVK